MKELVIKYHNYDSLEKLPLQDRELAAAAREACATSFSPYSGFRVGAAARLDSGEVIRSSNQESEVYPEGICAERGLLYFLQANRLQGRGEKIAAMAIASVPGEKECSPCGACRQVMADTRRRQGTPFKVIMCSDSSATVVEDPLDLLPFAFEL